MPTILVQNFNGEMPRLSNHLLTATQASSAINCSLQRGSLEPLRSPRLVQVAEGMDIIKSLYKHDVDGWLVYNQDISIIKSAVLDIPNIDTDNGVRLGHVFMTGNREYPTQYLANNKIYPLGIPRPSFALSVEVEEGIAIKNIEIFGFGAETSSDIPSHYRSEDSLFSIEEKNIAINTFTAVNIEGVEEEEEEKIQRSSSYCFTYVRELANAVIKQESAPSKPSDVYDIPAGGGAIISGIILPERADLGITHIRIYRTVSGYASADFRFLVELPIADIIEKNYEDTIHDKDVSAEILRTSIWDTIPDEARGLIKTDYGIYAAYRGNELLISEPFIPYAFPSVYRLTTEYNIVSLAHVDGTIVVLTSGRPYLVQGSSPESLSLIHLPIEQSCVSAKSVANIAGGVIYASPDGLMLFSSAQQSLLTANTFTRDQWQAMNPSCIIASVHDGRYIAFFEGTNKGFILNIGTNDIIHIELEKSWQVNALYHHSEDDCIYMGIKSGGNGDENGDGNCGVYRFEAGDTLEYLWKSKRFYFPRRTGMSAIKVRGEYNKNAVSLSIFGQDSQKARQTMRIADNRTKRIKPLRSDDDWSFEIRGNIIVHEVRLGGSVEGVEYAT